MTSDEGKPECKCVKEGSSPELLSSPDGMSGRGPGDADCPFALAALDFRVLLDAPEALLWKSAAYSAPVGNGS